MRATGRVRAAYRRLAREERPEAWIHVVPEADALAAAARVDAAVAAGATLPLAGVTLAVKDNIDVVGLPTTAACPAFAYVPARSAVCVERLVAAGAIVLGKTNLDQFATGLTGSRSPYGAVRDAERPAHVSGGSSSGSAVAVALGIADLGLATDTAGSGRVPAAFAGLVGLKPSVGLVPTEGVVPACASFDCVAFFARELGMAARALAIAADPSASGAPRDRATASRAVGTAVGAADLAAGRAAAAADLGPGPVAAASPRVVAVPPAEQLGDLTDAARERFAEAARALAASGVTLVALDLAPYDEAGGLLYGGAFVAERHAAVGAFVAAHPAAVEPTVAAIVVRGGRVTAAELTRDRRRLAALRREAAAALGADALLLPTTTRQPTLAAVAANPVDANDALGRYTRSGNLLGLCAVAVPAGRADGGHFGVSVLAPAGQDAVAAELAALLAVPVAPAPRAAALA